ncbi:MBL fold metallo-hydrolase [Brevibacillus brevis]|uniref:MBL fold metallo-hydrolase n=1 Tax=Brevibacillus brevis TaxID=1393 RepID=A0ABY9T5B2_BREBE|nr:MBL fold metallo-hydrolase [Brevibacillus brevis]WNC15293.1 MBL fold metallo-hydrolase [Brevibacillus brevis]
MEIAKNVHMLHLPFREMAIHPTMLFDGDTAVLVDTGFPGQMEELRAAMEQAGVALHQLAAVILTHQDIDHIGNLPELISQGTRQLNVYAHELERPYIEGDLPPIRDPQLAPLPKGKVTRTLADGEVLPYCGGIRVIHTPGHTEGHISLYLMQSKTLLAGDSLYSVNGTLMGVHAPTALDVDTARRSLKKYNAFDISSVICYHGGISTENIQEQIRAL